MTLFVLLLLAGPPQPSAQTLLTDRILLIGARSSDRLQPVAALTPGRPPVLAFRYLDGQRRHRFGDLSLVLDDAGH